MTDLNSPQEQTLPVAPRPGDGADPEDKSEVVWTRDALIVFWDFLKSIREAGRLGALSLSFHAVPPASAPSMEPFSYVGSHKQTTIAGSSSVSSIIPTSIIDGPLSVGSPLRMVDHIKVYHDAQYTQAVRTILRAWSYQKEGQKIRLLKEARLVLVDERSRGLLIC